MEQTVFDKILNTGEAELLIGESTHFEQMVRLVGLMEVVGELAAAVHYGDKSQAADSIGWGIVALTLLAAQLKLDVAGCIPEPYSGIKTENFEEEPVC